MGAIGVAVDLETPPAVAPAPLRYAAVIEDARRLVRMDQRERGYPGIAIAVSVDGETVWSEGFGYADLEHRVPMWPSGEISGRQRVEIDDGGCGRNACRGRTTGS